MIEIVIGVTIGVLVLFGIYIVAGFCMVMTDERNR